ncbi:MAG: 2-phospho-L-lactate guanylyltransferase [Deltaproteobacteria bacterium]|nr:2-phospho-L-lactate guanylyltransferase [Myxococcales bacterium]TDJ13511.1 MAG: 2-phospho-L-lactate guanylyltransferase [Deltaproteobacteria bacterium]TDJ20451.1 MAG: 2-phospho-L-lactate guanylyltransferase [Deltaproteobacteria bacterium]
MTSAADSERDRAAAKLAAVVPVKTLAETKSRLSPYLGRGGVERLTVAMLSDVLEALLGAQGLDRVAVVTPDTNVARAARDAGAEALLREDPSLNAAIDAAAGELSPGNDDALLVVLGDVAGIETSDIDTLLDSAPAIGVALAPSSDGGTAALLRSPAGVIGSAFGANSAKRHRERAEAAGVPFLEVRLDSLSLDLDELEDLDRFLARQGGGPRTRELLRELRSERT